ncbi:MAG: GtrA family protein [Candidatus Saccharimonadales bacterium]
MSQKKKQGRIKTLIEFLKVQVAGNALFWVTYLSYFVFDTFAQIPYPISFIMATITGNIVFFLLDRHWIYNEDSNKRKSSQEIRRFIIFMVLNFFLNIFIVQTLNDQFGISPYIGQFVAGAFFTIWTFLGLHFWVFQPDHTRYSSIRYQGKKKNGRKSTKQKTA